MYEKISRILENLIIDDWYSKNIQIQCRSLYQALMITGELDDVNTYLKDLYNLGAIYDCNVKFEEFREYMNEGIRNYLT